MASNALLCLTKEKHAPATRHPAMTEYMSVPADQWSPRYDDTSLHISRDGWANVPIHLAKVGSMTEYELRGTFNECVQWVLCHYPAAFYVKHQLPYITLGLNIDVNCIRTVEVVSIAFNSSTFEHVWDFGIWSETQTFM